MLVVEAGDAGDDVAREELQRAAFLGSACRHADEGLADAAVRLSRDHA